MIVTGTEDEETTKLLKGNTCHPPAISTVFPINRILHSISMRSILNIKTRHVDRQSAQNFPFLLFLRKSLSITHPSRGVHAQAFKKLIIKLK